MKTKTSAFYSYNPADGSVLWEGKAAEKKDVDLAVKKAADAFETWSSFSLDDRIACLKRFTNALSTSFHALAETISKETGKPLWDAGGEVQAMINKLNISVDAYNSRCGEKIILEETKKLRFRFKPHGVIAVFGPFNFPGHLPNGHMIPALLAGNTIVFKPSELTPLTGEKLFHLWKEAGLPSGTVNLVQGGKQTGKLLANSPGINGLLFTGSLKTGLALLEDFAKTPEKILALEMGGNNPLVIGSIKDIKAAVYVTIQSAFLSSGQRCSAARRLIVPEGPLGDAFLEALIQAIQKITVGPYTQIPEPFMGPVISKDAAKNLLNAQKMLLEKGGRPLVKMKLLQKDLPFLSPGLIDMSSSSFRHDREIFGPLLQVIRVQDFIAAIQEANNTCYGLTAGILSDSQDEFDFFYKNVNAGVINWNTPLTMASSALGFGGIKKSGNHRPSAYYAADYSAYPVSSTETPSLQLPKKPFPGLENL